MKKAIVFDLDGTLWDSSHQVTESWNMALNNCGHSPITYPQLCSYLGKGPKEIADLMLADLEEPRRTEVMNICFDEENRYLAKHGGNLYPDLEETLKILSAEYALYIASNCSNGYIETFLSYHNLGPYFSDFEHPGRTGLDKASNIRLLLERNKIEKAVYVGDTQGDCDSAKKAELPFIFASYGFGSVKEPDGIIDCFKELPQKVKSLF